MAIILAVQVGLLPLLNHELMAASSDDDLDKDAKIAVIAITAPYALISTGLAIYNYKSLKSGTPGTVAGIFGTLFGAATTVAGVASIASGEDVLIITGAGCTAVGMASTYYGIKSLAAVRRKNIERQDVGLSIHPLICVEGGGGYNLGLELGFTF